MVAVLALCLVRLSLCPLRSSFSHSISLIPIFFFHFDFPRAALDCAANVLAAHKWSFLFLSSINGRFHIKKTLGIGSEGNYNANF